MTYHNTKNSGFSLIEVLLYTLFVSFIIGGVLIAAYNMIEGTESNSENIVMQSEANFLIRKIEWGLSGARNVIVSGSNQILTIDKWGIGVDGGSFEPDLIFKFDSGNLSINGGSGDIVLNSDFIEVSSSSFEYDSGSGEVKASFYVGEYPFETIRYIRK
ncbi:MAG: hypothetical protein COV29_03525 [Candidatus Yanofskybacteria bacterium CG10_big_fil_rev_8_21_14_0_10_36_16]|uniref:Prepilin-type N-terminal cleavage/methylation domain-containing protein n=1 Tax=Candidatus Yanofskybacteria bacterium CG10_big_fil_rev_8_21_14_0_10_36_16 TaxID=1975096 RepID=A0A2J0Q745_9BACT|nr:MAG: hypothetical protein COV29_03525 [Candidatus Yanofskybacteria bacterium CG10_big_fil_rev_8_21_14_0_10_36_16]